MRWNAIDWIAFVLIVIGGINWGLVGFFRYDLVDSLFGTMTGLTRLVYGLVGIAAVWQLVTALARRDARRS